MTPLDRIIKLESCETQTQIKSQKIKLWDLKHTAGIWPEKGTLEKAWKKVKEHLSDAASRLLFFFFLNYFWDFFFFFLFLPLTLTIYKRADRTCRAVEQRPLGKSTEAFLTTPGPGDGGGGQKVLYPPERPNLGKKN